MRAPFTSAKSATHAGATAKSASQSLLNIDFRVMRFSGKSVLVTGAGSGIGEAAARAFAAEGASVGCLDVDFDAASRVAGAIGGRAVQCDVSAEESVRDAVRRFDRVDVLFNNA